MQVGQIRRERELKGERVLGMKGTLWPCEQSLEQMHCRIPPLPIPPFLR